MTVRPAALEGGEGGVVRAGLEARDAVDPAQAVAAHVKDVGQEGPGAVEVEAVAEAREVRLREGQVAGTDPLDEGHPDGRGTDRAEHASPGPVAIDDQVVRDDVRAGLDADVDVGQPHGIASLGRAPAQEVVAVHERHPPQVGRDRAEPAAAAHLPPGGDLDHLAAPPDLGTRVAHEDVGHPDLRVGPGDAHAADDAAKAEVGVRPGDDEVAQVVGEDHPSRGHVEHHVVRGHSRDGTGVAGHERVPGPVEAHLSPAGVAACPDGRHELGGLGHRHVGRRLGQERTPPLGLGDLVAQVRRHVPEVDGAFRRRAHVSPQVDEHVIPTARPSATASRRP